MVSYEELLVGGLAEEKAIGKAGESEMTSACAIGNAPSLTRLEGGSPSPGGAA